MNYLNAFASVNKMNTNETKNENTVHKPCSNTSKSGANVFIVFFILNAINTGNSILYWICYGCLMISIVGAMQSVFLYIFSKYYKNKG